MTVGRSIPQFFVEWRSGWTSDTLFKPVDYLDQPESLRVNLWDSFAHADLDELGPRLFDLAKTIRKCWIGALLVDHPQRSFIVSVTSGDDGPYGPSVTFHSTPRSAQGPPRGRPVEGTVIPEGAGPVNPRFLFLIFVLAGLRLLSGAPECGVGVKDRPVGSTASAAGGP